MLTASASQVEQIEALPLLMTLLVLDGNLCDIIMCNNDKLLKLDIVDMTDATSILPLDVFLRSIKVKLLWIYAEYSDS